MCELPAQFLFLLRQYFKYFIYIIKHIPILLPITLSRKIGKMIFYCENDALENTT